MFGLKSEKSQCKIIDDQILSWDKLQESVIYKQVEHATDKLHNVTKYLDHVICLPNKPNTSSGPVSFKTLWLVVLQRWGRCKAETLFPMQRRRKGIKTPQQNNLEFPLTTADQT